MNAPDPGTPAVRTCGLVCAYGAVQAVRGLDLDVRRGEMFGLVGPDGAGKSTAVRALCGLVRPVAGTAEVLGRDLFRELKAVKAGLGYLSQEFTLYGDLTVDENLAFFARLHGVADFRRRRDELLEFTRLTPFRKRLADRLSGGMKKKLALACTLIHTPELLLLDEPSTGVDPVSRGEFWSILSAVLDQGVTVLMTTPYLDEAERCHRVGLMHRGALLRTGTPDEIKAAMPGRVYRIAAPRPAAACRALRALWPASRLVLFGDRLHFWTPDGDDEARRCVRHLEEQGLGPSAFEPAAPSLEDAFVALVEDGGTAA